SYIGLDEGSYFTNTVTEACVQKGAVLQHYKIQREGQSCYHVGNFDIRQEQDSRVESFSIALGGSLVRNDIRARLDAEGAGIRMNGLYLAGGRQHIDNHTRVDHLQPRTWSHENYRGVLNEHARGVFNGKVIVHKDAQKTDASQNNANLLLSDNAEVDTKPELEIYADDVKCAHGATVGQLDQDMLFYLRSRAIDETTARNLLTYAFVDEVLREVGIAPLRRHLEQMIISRLPQPELIREFAV
ncbi:MAG: Fe-S cluster assembly protein SufD, partial [Gammaproteobacteria bacterium]